MEISDGGLLQVNATIVIGLLILLTLGSFTTGTNQFIVEKSRELHDISLQLRSDVDDIARRAESLQNPNVTESVDKLRGVIDAIREANFASEQAGLLFPDEEELQDRLLLLRYIIISIVPFAVSSILIILGQKKWAYRITAYGFFQLVAVLVILYSDYTNDLDTTRREIDSLMSQFDASIRQRDLLLDSISTNFTNNNTKTSNVTNIQP